MVSVEAIAYSASPALPQVTKVWRVYDAGAYSVAISAFPTFNCRTSSADHDSAPTSDSSSILENGKRKPGVYKIQNIQSRTYLDVEVHTMEVCCRPAINLEEGRRFVCRCPSQWLVSDNQKWEIKSLGAGYPVRLVSVLMLSDGTSAIVH